MDLLKAELERKRKAVELAKSSSAVARIEAPTRRKNDGGSAGGKGRSRRRGDDDGATEKKRQYLKTADLRRFEERRREEEEEEERRRRRGGLGGRDHDAWRTKKKNRWKRYDDDSSDDDDGSSGGDDVGHAAGARDASRGDDVDGSPRTGDVDGSDRRGGDEYGRGRTGRSSREEGSSAAAAAAARDNNEDGGDDEGAAKISRRNGKEEEHDEDDADLLRLTPDQITSMLRAFGLPVRLFGEHPTTRLSRLRAARKQQKAAQAVGSEMDEFRLGSGHGIRNPFLERNSQKNKGGGGHDDDGKDGKKGGTAKTGDGGGGDAKASASTAAGSGALGGDRDRMLLQDDAHEKDDVQDDPHKKIHRFFKNLLRQWEDDLAHRPDAAKRTAAGKTETKTLKQCRDYIRPLFKLCKSRRLEGAMMNHILKIVDYCEQGEFVKAHDAYMDVAIGRAAWPIGVTMVGIHARSGRAKIESSNVAHVMNSELQRKYLTSVKRIMSYYQKKRVDVPPSKKVMNM